jgi:hypothetical protein
MDTPHRSLLCALHLAAFLGGVRAAAVVDFHVRASESPLVPEPGLEPGRRQGDRGF